MTKYEANRILDRIRDGYPVSLAIATQALQRTGDISGIPDKPLCFDGDERGFNRSCEVDGQEMGERNPTIGWSRYLDCRENQGVKE